MSLIGQLVGPVSSILDKVIEDNPKIVQEYLGGKDKLLGFFVGQAMKITKGKANPKILNDILKNFLEKEEFFENDTIINQN